MYSSMAFSKFTIYVTIQFSSVAQPYPTLCDPMNRSTPGLPVHHHLPEFTQTHVHRVRDAIQPSHPRSSPSSPAPNPSQHQSLFQWVNSSHEVAKVLEFQQPHNISTKNKEIKTGKGHLRKENKPSLGCLLKSFIDKHRLVQLKMEPH